MRFTGHSCWLLGAVALWLCASGTALSHTEKNVGEVIDNLDKENLELFFEGKRLFLRKHTPADGLGPFFNETSCAGCHHIPKPGGAGDHRNAIILAGAYTADGRFDSLDGRGGPVFQKHALPGYAAKAIPAAATVRTTRVPPSLFGLGLVEAIPESAILANARSTPNADGVRGRANIVDGRVGRFGYKAQVPTLFEFMFTATLNELGISTPFALRPALKVVSGSNARERRFEINAQTMFKLMYFVQGLAPLKPRRQGAAERSGQKVFDTTGCNQCHVPSFNTGANKIRAFADVEVPLYSDLLLHDMGEQLADSFEDGAATGREFRTTPLWGAGRKRYFLHDGRANSLDSAIRLHGGEAAQIVRRYEQLSARERGELLKFLRSL